MAQPTLTPPADHPFWDTDSGVRLRAARRLRAVFGDAPIAQAALAHRAEPWHDWIPRLVDGGYLIQEDSQLTWTDMGYWAAGGPLTSSDAIAGTQPTAGDR